MRHGEENMEMESTESPRGADYPLDDDTNVMPAGAEGAQDLERRRLEARVRRSEGSLRTMVANLADAVVVTDAEGVIRFVNPAAEELFGRAAETLTGHPFGFAVAAGRGSEISIRRPDRQLRIGELRAASIEWAGGPALMSSIRDITDRKQAEEELRTSEARYEDLYHNAPDMFLSVDPDTWRVAGCNRTLARTVGRAVSDLEGCKVTELFLAECHTALDAALVDVRTVGKARNVELRLAAGADQTVDASASFIRVSDERGENYIRVVLHDVTSRKQAEKKLRDVEQQLTHSQRLEGIGRLAGGIAHDFNNVLTAILGYSQMLLDQIGEDELLGDDLREIQTAGKRAAALTGQLLAFSRKQVLNLMVVDLNPVVREVEQMLQRLIGEDVEMKTRLAPDHCLVKADQTQLEQILINLAVNARDAMPRGGVLQITTSHETFAEDRVVDRAPVAAGEYEALVVQDNGTGMDEQTKAHLFEPFFTTKRRDKGTGLGLATVYGTVKQLGGFVFVESQPQHGTTFKIYLPRTDAPLEPRVAHEQEVSSMVGNEVVLLVEDDEGVRRFSRTVLARHGYQVLEADTPGRAISVSEGCEGRIDLVLTDMVMPGMNGAELARLLEEQRPEVKLLYMSGYTAPELARTLGSEVQAGLLWKPFTPDTLLQRVRRTLDG